jgi:hypothetical protein
LTTCQPVKGVKLIFDPAQLAAARPGCPPHCFLRPGRTRDCSEIPHRSNRQQRCLLSVDHKQKSFPEFCGNACGAAATVRKIIQHENFISRLPINSVLTDFSGRLWMCRSERNSLLALRAKVRPKPAEVGSTCFRNPLYPGDSSPNCPEVRPDSFAQRQKPNRRSAIEQRPAQLFF